MARDDLRERCARYFTWRDLIECGETWHRLQGGATPVDNVPRRDETWAGLEALARDVLDPLREHFGAVELSYGFAGPSLTKHIARGIAPALDQHAGAEETASGRRVCARGGQSCDLRVPGVSAVELGRWIHASLPFDRLYLYGPSRSVHVSHGPEHSRAVYAMVSGARRVVPRAVRDDDWGALSQWFEPR